MNDLGVSFFLFGDIFGSKNVNIFVNLASLHLVQLEVCLKFA